MKLVEFKDDVQQPQNPNYTYNDTTYAQPKVLLNLDKSMSEILFNHDLSDHDKYSLYNQTLQRYLHFVKQNNNPTSTIKNIQNMEPISEPEIFNGRLSSPVRNFFEIARNSNAHEQSFPFKTTPPYPIPFQQPEQPKKKRATAKVSFPTETPSRNRKKTARKLVSTSRNSQIPRRSSRTSSARATLAINRLTKPCSVVLSGWVPNTLE